MSPGKPTRLPRWRDKGKVEKASRNVNEVVLGVRVASLVSGGAPATDDLLRFTNDPEIGFFSMKLPSHLTNTFANSSTGSDLISRTLMRRLKGRRDTATGVFAWRRDLDGRVTLFGAMSRAAHGDSGTYAYALSGLRFGRSLARCGVTIENFQDIPAETFAELYDLPQASFVRGWADWNTSQFVENHSHGVEPIEFDFAAKRFRTPQEIGKLDGRNEGVWNDYLARCGLPTWFGASFLEVFVDALVRTPEDARRHRHAEETVSKRLEKRSKKDAAKVEIERIEDVDAETLDTLRFFRGSPAEFAAFATAEGQLIGIYCPTELMHSGEDLYEQLRQAGKLG